LIFLCELVSKEITMESPRTPVNNQMSRSERDFEASRALNEWYIQAFNQRLSDLSRIEYIHTQMCEKWSTRDNSDDWTDDNSWQDYNSPPPWNPKLKDIDMSWTQPEKLIEILNMSEYVLNRDLIELPERNKIVESLEEPLEAWHITWVKALCVEAEGYAEPDDTDDEESEWEYDEDAHYPMQPVNEENTEGLQRILNLQPRQLFQDEQEELEQQKHRQELSRKGFSILEKIMEEQKLDEGDYIEMCNIFKELYK